MFDSIRKRVEDYAFRRHVMKATTLQMLPGWVKDPIRDFNMKTIVDFGYSNSAVYSVLRLYAESFPEPELHVHEEQTNGDQVMIPDHDMRALIAQPNEFMDEDALAEFAITYQGLGGNIYLWKERDQLGVPIGLWPFHDGMMHPVLHPTKWISSYALDVEASGRREQLLIPPSEIIHLRWGVDPRQPQVGMSPMFAASRAIDMDTEYLRYQHALAHNDAVPRTVIKTRLGYNDDKLKQLKDQWKQRFGGNNRGDVAFLNDPDAEIMRIGSSLQELAVEAIHNIPESRVAAVYGGAPVGFLAGLNVHLQRSTFSNYEEAERAFHRRILTVKWRAFEGGLTRGLRADFNLPPSMSLRYDLSRVAALAGERQAQQAHAREMYTSGTWSRNESRAATGQRPLAEDVILEPGNSLAVPVEYAPDPIAQKAARRSGRVDVTVPRQSLRERRLLETEYTREIAGDLAAQKAAVLDAIDG